MAEKMGKAKKANGSCESVASKPSLTIHAEENGEPPGLSSRPLSTYEELIRSLSDRLVEAQRPIRILDAIKWDDAVERAFFAARCRELPPVTRDYYLSRPLPFDPEQKRREFLSIERGIRQHLGKYNAAGRIMTRMCAEYRQVIDLLVNRGTPTFAALSERLYGGSADRFHAGDPSLGDLGGMLAGTLDNLAREAELAPDAPLLDATEAMHVLSQRLTEFFQNPSAVRIRLSDGIVADAAAGSDYIKLREDARFTMRDIRVLEVHEGWVHLGTTLNGQQQPICTFLSKGPPSSTITQEGLAVLTEVFSFASHPGRVRRLTHRIEGVALAESGADFLDVYRFFLDEGYKPRESYQHTMRIFRGSLPSGCGPFTKDLCYSKGFVQLYNFMRLAVSRGMVGRVPLLFCGKTNLDDIKTLALLADEGLLAPPRYVPPPFANLQALAAWLCYANFFTFLSHKRIEEDYSTFF
ncbi:MAG TPA: flavohemoglobin expression-modulating QEGLA motif protein [Gemmataceae bacterium]|nr:flavohemoglobin expression-modulating QEGLA motif protein [Gemmataceae bacterium]